MRTGRAARLVLVVLALLVVGNVAIFLWFTSGGAWTLRNTLLVVLARRSRPDDVKPTQEADNVSKSATAATVMPASEHVPASPHHARANQAITQVSAKRAVDDFGSGVPGVESRHSQQSRGGAPRSATSTYARPSTATRDALNGSRFTADGLAGWLRPLLRSVTAAEVAGRASALASRPATDRSSAPDLVAVRYGGGGFTTLGRRSARALLTVVVCSAPAHEARRQAIRQSWGHVALRTDVTMAFLVGRGGDVVQLRLDREHARYGDLVQANFTDSYRNLTLKTVAMLEWLSRFCAATANVLKVDDDVFLHVPNLFAFLDRRGNATRTFYGKLALHWKPFRTKKSKYYVSEAEFQPDEFPKYVTGPAYLFTGDLIQDLYRESLVSRFLFLEDVFLTGIVASKVGARCELAKGFLNVHKTDPCSLNSSISIHQVSPSEQYSLNIQVLSGEIRCKPSIATAKKHPTKKAKSKQ